jgi:hypothetical protein
MPRYAAACLSLRTAGAIGFFIRSDRSQPNIEAAHSAEHEIADFAKQDSQRVGLQCQRTMHMDYSSHRRDPKMTALIGWSLIERAFVQSFHDKPSDCSTATAFEAQERSELLVPALPERARSGLRR